MKGVLTSLLFACAFYSVGQTTSALKSGFDAMECDAVLHLSDAFMNRVTVEQFASSQKLQQFSLINRSPAVGLDNMYDLWLRSDSTVFILLRGTSSDPKSLLADFYCAMMPAKGTIQLNNSKQFDYKLADDERAGVHAGFLTGFAYIAVDLKPKLDSLYHLGYHQFVIGGHSMGGALAFFTSAWLHYLVQDGTFPNLTTKTYAIATPKVGNMYFAYDYDYCMQSKWSFSITNSYDAIPEMPMTTQQLEADMNADNPILDAKNGLKSERFLKRMALKFAYNSMERKATKSSKSYQKYLGKYVGKFVQDQLPELKMPEPLNSTYFLRPAVPISMQPKSAYFDYFQTQKDAFYHHSLHAYRFLLRQQFQGLSPLN